MNQRIKQLKEQATSYTWNGDGVTEDLDEGKFAQLIVQECASFIDSHEQVDKYSEAMDIVYGEDLLKHFGVEL